MFLRFSPCFYYLDAPRQPRSHKRCDLSWKLRPARCFFSLLLTNPDVSGLRFSKLGHFGFEEKTEEAGFPSRTRRPVPQISQIKAFSSRHPSRSVTGPGARTLLVLTPAPAFSPPPQKRARRRGPLRRAAPKDEERASGSRLYLLERENKRGSDGFFFFKREKKQE